MDSIKLCFFAVDLILRIPCEGKSTIASLIASILAILEQFDYLICYLVGCGIRCGAA